MFTGLIEQQAEVIANHVGNVANRLILKSSFSELVVGESIAVNGTCLTVLPQDDGGLAFDVSPETLMLTTLGTLSIGDKVNLERSMQANARFGGHYVSGHVDATARVLSVVALGDYMEMMVGDFSLPAHRYLLPKGSITLDGVSLTINTVDEAGIKIMLVPHTMAQTTLGRLQVGQRLNVEFDYITRIVAHQLTVSGQMKGEVEL